MAKKSMIAREVRRKKLAKKYFQIRINLKNQNTVHFL